MPSELSWPNSNRSHYRTCSPKLTSPVILLVDDANTQPTKQLYQEELVEQAEPERRGGVDIWLLKSSASSTGAFTGPPMERESLYEDDIPDSGENTSCDESPPEKSKEAKKASIPHVSSRAYGGLSARRESNARYKSRGSNQPESVYSIAPTGTAPSSPGPSRESAYSVAEEYGMRPMSRPAGKPEAYYSLANLERFASPTTIAFPESINSASCWPAPLQPMRNSGSTATRGRESRSDAELSRRTSTTTASSLSLRNSARSLNKQTRQSSSASQRASLPPSEKRYSPRPKANRPSENKQTGGWPSLTRASDGVAPISERKLSPRTVISRDSLPVSEGSRRPGRSRAPPAGSQNKRVSGQGSWMATSNPRLKERTKDWCEKCYGYQATRIEERDRSKDLETVKKFKGKKDVGHQTRCTGQDRSSAGQENCFEYQKRVVRREGVSGRQKSYPGYRKRVLISKPEREIAKWQVEHGSNDVPPQLISKLAAESVAGLFPWRWT